MQAGAAGARVVRSACRGRPVGERDCRPSTRARRASMEMGVRVALPPGVSDSPAGTRTPSRTHNPARSHVRAYLLLFDGEELHGRIDHRLAVHGQCGGRRGGRRRGSGHDHCATPPCLAYAPREHFPPPPSPKKAGAVRTTRGNGGQRRAGARGCDGGRGSRGSQGRGGGGRGPTLHLAIHHRLQTGTQRYIIPTHNDT